MLKRINQIINIILASCIGVFIGHGFYVCWEYKTKPSLYAMQSAPWYTSILVYGGFTVVVIIVALIVKTIIRKKMKE